MSAQTYRLAITLIAGSMIAAGAETSAADEPSTKTSIGLAITAWEPAIYETPEAKECPSGFHAANKDNWLAQFPTEQERADYTRKYLHLGPSGILAPTPVSYMLNRGPNGQNVVYNPTLVNDIPLREVQSKIGYGFNLDGTDDGKATQNSCKHEKFISPEGAPGIDNQLYRIFGCLVAQRKGGSISFYGSHQMREPTNRILIEVTGVDDERNDDHVDVAFYKGVDGLIADSSGNLLPWSTQRIDVRFPQYMSKTTGKIVDGELVTDPVDFRWDMYVINYDNEHYMRGMRLRLKLSETGAAGMVGGYVNLREWWRGLRNDAGFTADVAVYWDPPAMHEAAYRLADGYPDPQTGQCTALSAAYQVQAVRAFIVRPSKDDPLAVDVNLQAARRTVSGQHTEMAAIEKSK